MGLGTPVRRRSRDSGCQWLTIGMALGVGTSLVFCLASYIIGFIEIRGFESSNDSTPQQIIQVVTSQVSATPEPLSDTATIEPSSTDENGSDLPAIGAESPTDDPSATDATLAEDNGAVPSFTPPATSLPSSSNGTEPTRLPSSPGDLNADAVQPPAGVSAAPVEVGTEVPALGSATITPQFGPTDIPQTLLSVASPLVNIQGGAFTMGTTLEEGLQAVNDCVNRDGGTCTEDFIEDSLPAHQVTLNDFQMEIFEVSVNQYVNFLNSLAEGAPAGIRIDRVGCGGQPCVLTVLDEPNSIIEFDGTEYRVRNPSFYNNHPIIFVTWIGARSYCEAIGRRLPTEAEWERAARGPTNSIYPWGPEWIPENANTSRSTNGGQNTTVVDSYPIGASQYGPVNMAGNVSEWVWDYYAADYYSRPEAAGPNPRGPASSDRRVIRGGGWDNVPLFARTVHRMYAAPGDARASLGFRCAADPN